MFLTQLTQFNFLRWFWKELFGHGLDSHVCFVVKKLQGNKAKKERGEKRRNMLKNEAEVGFTRSREL